MTALQDNLAVRAAANRNALARRQQNAKTVAAVVAKTAPQQ